MTSPDIDQLCADLQKVWYEQIPLSAAMQVAVESFENDVLVVAADLAPNINLHGTGFAGRTTCCFRHNPTLTTITVALALLYCWLHIDQLPDSELRWWSRHLTICPVTK